MVLPNAAANDLLELLRMVFDRCGLIHPEVVAPSQQHRVKADIDFAVVALDTR